MRTFLLLALLLLASCAPKVVKVEKPTIPTYYKPVKGEILKKKRGVFIRSRCGEFVRAVEAGEVVYAGRDLNNYGWVVIIKQKDGLVSVYGKLGKPWVRAGERVRSRQVIGRVAKGRMGCGLYYELRNSRGEPVEVRMR